MQRKVYVVVKRTWMYDDNFHTSTSRPARAFTDRDQAEAYRRWCDQRERDRDRELDPTSRSYEVIELDVTA
jgi:hypothetical protein